MAIRTIREEGDEILRKKSGNRNLRGGRPDSRKIVIIRIVCSFCFLLTFDTFHLGIKDITAF